MTQLEKANRGEITDAVRSIALEEGVDVETVRSRVAEGKIAILVSKTRKNKVVGIGKA